MSEETGTTETATVATETTAVTTAEVTPPQSFVDGQGNFTEGWEGAFLTEDQRAHARVSGGRVKSVGGMLETIINSDKMISGDKILRPNDSFGDTDWDDFHKAGGWTGEAVPITAPEGFPEGVWSEDRATKYSEAFNALRLNPKQIAGLTELHNADILEQITNSNNGNEASIVKLRADLLAEKGNAFTQFEHNGNIALFKGAQGNDEFKERVKQKFGADIDFVRLMGNLGSNFAESGSIPVIKMAPTPNDVQSKIDAVMKSDAFNKPMHPEHKATMAKLRQLHIEKGNIKVPA